MKKLGLIKMFACGTVTNRNMNKWTWKMLSSMIRDETTLYDDIIEYGFCTETELENIVTMYNR